MKKILFICLIPVHIFSQNLSGRIQANDTVNLITSSISPTSFPEIEVLFKAENNNGLPYWNLQQTDISVYENNQPCQITSFNVFTEETPINIALILDHSGSMAWDFLIIDSIYRNITNPASLNQSFWDSVQQSLPVPLEIAKKSIKNFTKSFNQSKDTIFLLPFSSEVENSFLLNGNDSIFNRLLDTIRPAGATAFYDAVYKGSNLIKSKTGINIVIALTDGQNNSSVKNINDVIELCQVNKTPVYTIGFGGAFKDSLQLLSDSTNGISVYSKSSNKLDSIYQLLRFKIQAYYQLRYTSLNWEEESADRNLEIRFNIDDVHVVNSEQNYKLPDTVIEYIKKTNTEKLLVTIAYGAGSLTLIALGIIVIKRRKKTSIEKVYPNPTNGTFNVKLKGELLSILELKLINQKGLDVEKQKVSLDSTRFDITNQPKGFYTLILLKNGKVVSSKKVVKS